MQNIIKNRKGNIILLYLVIGILIISFSISIVFAKPVEDKASVLLNKKLKKIKKVNSSTVDLTKNMNKSTKYNNIFGLVEIKMSDEDIEVSIDESDSFFRYTNLKMKDKKTKQGNSNNISPFVANKIATNMFNENALEIANALDSTDKKLVETTCLQDNTIAYKWVRAYNGYEYNFDFILVIVDSESGEIVQASKNFVSKLPSNMDVVINSDKAKENAIKILSENGINNPEIIESELKIANMRSDDDKLNTNTTLAYCIKFSYNYNSVKANGFLLLDSKTGLLMELRY